MSNGYLSEADDPNGSSDDMLAANTTDLGGITTLLLPSNLGIDAFHSSNLGHLHDMELRLRISQANDALNGLRLALVDKAVIFWNVVAVRKQAAIYKQCQKAMVILGASAETLTCYQQLQTSDLTVTTAIINQNAHAHQASNLPWFWSIDVLTDMESITWMSEFYQTHWLRAKAVQDCWLEEEELLMAKFQWTINFFNHQAIQWQTCWAQSAELGTSCYTARQIVVYERLSEHAQLKQQSMNLKNIPTLMDIAASNT
ncbi:hypothetical protein BKA82DRAFT_4361200 [Pisolithus tinctorius]|nr:hypothetical protein BKA82DRAFT_4361200 [Pisolithus tinctorius]